MNEFAPDKALYLFFHPNDEQEAFVFRSGQELGRLLNECPRFEFWVCDNPVTYLFCFNHHDYLMGWGKAAPWLVARGKHDSA